MDYVFLQVVFEILERLPLAAPVELVLDVAEELLGGGIVGGCILMLVLTLVLSTIAAWILDKTLLKWLMV